MHCPPCLNFFASHFEKWKDIPVFFYRDASKSVMILFHPVSISLLQFSSLCLLHFAPWLSPSSQTITQDLAPGKSTQIANTLRHKHVYCPRAFCSMIQDFSFFFFLCVMFLFVYLLAETVKQTRHDFFLPIRTLFALVWRQIEQYLILSIPRDYWGNAFLLQHSLSLLFSFSFSVCISQLPSHGNCIFPY